MDDAIHASESPYSSDEDRLRLIIGSAKSQRAINEWVNFPSCPMWSEPHPNPLIRACQKILIRQKQEAVRDAKLKLFEQIGRLSEHSLVLSHLSAIYLAIPEKGLVPVALHNHSDTASGVLGWNSEGLVPGVARSGVQAYVADVSMCRLRDYRQINIATRSERVVPIHWQGEVLGLINLESRTLNGLAECEIAIENAIPSMIFSLLVLRSCYATDESWLPWNPMVHGWDLSKTISQMLQAVGTKLSSVSPKLSVWYPDQQKECLFAYAVYGYDWAYVTGQSLSLVHSQIGKSLSNSPSRLIKLDVNQFVNNIKAQELGIEEAWSAPVYEQEVDISDAVAAITCYFSGKGRRLNVIEQNDRELAKEAIVELAKLFGKLIPAYKKQRQIYASAFISATNHANCHNERRTRFEEWLTGLRTILDSPAGSVFQLRKATEILRCIASTGFYNPERRTRSVRLRDHFYDLAEGAKSHTKTIWELAGKALRRLRVGNPQEKGLPDSTPIVADHRNNAEFLPGQMLDSSRACPRQLLGCAYLRGIKRVGVVRLIRRADARPFTVCDAELLELLAGKFAPKPTTEADASVLKDSDERKETGDYRI